MMGIYACGLNYCWDQKKYLVEGMSCKYRFVIRIYTFYMVINCLWILDTSLSNWSILLTFLKSETIQLILRSKFIFLKVLLIKLNIVHIRLIHALLCLWKYFYGGKLDFPTINYHFLINYFLQEIIIS